MAKQLLLRLRERRLQEQIRQAPVAERQSLGKAIETLRQEIEHLATMAAANPR
jgi:hypothetical protein